ncbi:MAG: hypothetical protein AAGE01_19440 [Pseudomonadota bacterium]
MRHAFLPLLATASLAQGPMLTRDEILAAHAESQANAEAKNILDGNEWESRRAGLFGGRLIALKVDPQNPDILFVNSDDGVFRSTDEGATWARTDSSYGVARDIDIDPTDGQKLFVGTNSGVRRSLDGGLSWSEPLPGPNVPVDDIDVDRSNPMRVIATARRELYLSTNGGASFTPLGTPPMSENATVEAVEFDAGDAMNIAIIIRDNFDVEGEQGVFTSTDLGVTWQDRTQALRDAVSATSGSVVLERLGASPDTPGLLLAEGEIMGSGSGIFRSTDFGMTWTRAGDFSSIFVFNRDFAFDSNDADRIITGDRLSTNGGASFSRLPESPGFFVNSMIAPQFSGNDSNRLLVAGEDFTFAISEDLGASWTVSIEGIDTARVRAVAALESGHVLAAVRSIGIYRSADFGRSWELAQAVPDDADFTSAFEVDPNDPATVYTVLRSFDAADAPILVSRNSGETWTSITATFALNGAASIAIDPSNSDRIYVGQVCCSGEQFYRSENGGASFEPMTIDQALDANNTVLDIEVGPQGTLYAAVDALIGNDDFVYRSDNGGSTWTLLTGLPANRRTFALRIDPLDPDTVFAGGFCGGVFRSTDRGDIWEARPDSGFCQFSLAFDPNDPRRVVTSEGIISYDRGERWDRLGGQLIGATSVVFAPAGNLLIRGGNFGFFVRAIDVRQQEVPDPGVAAGDEFGSAVSVSGNLFAVGVPGDDEAGNNAGAIFIYRREGTEIVLEDKIVAPPGFGTSELGRSIDLSNGLLAAGAPGNGPIAKGAQSMQAAIFERLGNDWRLKTPIASVGGTANDEFGASVALSGDMLIVGAPMDSEGDGGTGSGAAYAFQFEGDTSTFMTKTKPPIPIPGGQFGSAVAASGGMVVVGAPNGAADTGAAGGAVTLYDLVRDNLEEIAVIDGEGPADGDAFGTSIALDGTAMVVGAPGEDAEDGSAYVFRIDPSAIVQLNRLTAAGDGGRFGQSVDAAADRLVIGAPDQGTGTAFLVDLSSLDEGIEPIEAPAGTRGFGSAVAADPTGVLVGAPEANTNAGSATLLSDTAPVFGNGFER